MPSARELLEQADALMRRNRSPLMDDIPVLTDSVPEVTVGRPKRDEPPAESNAPDTIPMLTESVSPAPAAAKGAVVEEGEPSDWLQTGGREPSVIGDAPDSIVIVPAVEHEVREEIVVEAPPDVEEAFDEELAQRAGVPAQSAEPPPPQVEPEPPPSQVEPEPPPTQVEPEPPPTQVEPEPRFVPAPLADIPPVPPPPETLAWEEDTVIRAPEEGVVEEEEIAPIEIEPVEVAAPPVPEAPIPMAPVVDSGPSAAERQAQEDARWAGMAEEIRMQVLQRIDLFTDTGLRDQLGARLQPIVDRASADLVATINQHVGDLLRAYVAEAIEREIENWRRGN